MSRTARRVDPQRRQRIIDATLQVITDQGISGLSHRRVAAAAGVTLSATSYYFGTLEELVEAAFTESIAHDRELIGSRLAELPPGGDPIAMITAVICELIADRAAGVRSLELCVAALRSPGLRPLALAWEDSWKDLLAPHLGELRARVATALMAGLVQRGFMTDPAPTTAEVSEVLRAALTAAPSA